MPKKCTIDGCDSPARSSEFCGKHYARFKRHGDPNVTTRRPPGSVTDEDRKRWKRQDYEKHRDKYIANAKSWSSRFPEKEKAIREKPENKIKARERRLKWYAENRESQIENAKRWARENRGLKYSQNAARRAKKKNATLPWLSAVHFEEIRKVYLEAERLTAETGVLHHVDHIVPLCGKEVSGLHVPWNLRAIPAPENLSKGAKFIDSIA